MTGKTGDPRPAASRTWFLPKTESAPAASPDRTVTITNTSADLNARRYEARSLRTGPSRAPRPTWRRQGSTPARVEPLHHVGTQLVADRIGVSVRGAQQPLHPIRGDLAGGRGQRPAVLALQLAHQPTQMGPGERPGDPGVHSLRPTVQSCTSATRP